jgi:hypothetical protein
MNKGEWRREEQKRKSTDLASAFLIPPYFDATVRVCERESKMWRRGLFKVAIP